MTDTIWPPDFTNSTGSKYNVLIQYLRAAIRQGEFQPGERLPPVRDLAWQLGVTPGTVARAYRLGVDEGLLSAVVGRGTFVAGVAKTRTTQPEALISQTTDRGHRFPGLSGT